MRHDTDGPENYLDPFTSALLHGMNKDFTTCLAIVWLMGTRWQKLRWTLALTVGQPFIRLYWWWGNK